MATFNLHLQFDNALLKYLNTCVRQRQVIKLCLLIKGTEICVLPETSIDFVGDDYSTILFILWGLLKRLQLMEYISIIFKIYLAISRAKFLRLTKSAIKVFLYPVFLHYYFLPLLCSTTFLFS